MKLRQENQWPMVGAEELRLWVKSQAEGHSIMALLKAEKR